MPNEFQAVLTGKIWPQKWWRGGVSRSRRDCSAGTPPQTRHVIESVSTVVSLRPMEIGTVGFHFCRIFYIQETCEPTTLCKMKFVRTRDRKLTPVSVCFCYRSDLRKNANAGVLFKSRKSISSVAHLVRTYYKKQRSQTEGL